MKTKNLDKNIMLNKFITNKIQIKNISFIIFYWAYEVKLLIFFSFNNKKMLFFVYFVEMFKVVIFYSMSSTWSTFFF
jgi:hypothetical protein